MRTIFYLCVIIIFGLLASSCSQNTNSSNGAFITVNTYSDSSSIPYLKVSKLNTDKILIPNYDMLHLKSVSLLITELTFSSNSSNQIINNDTIKSGPLLFYFDSTGYAYSSVSGFLPAGNYNNIKFKLHQFSQDESNIYRNDPRFWVFTTNQRFSTVIEVTTFINNDTLNYYYRSTAVADITIDKPFSLKEGGNYQFLISVRAVDLFMKNGTFLDPINPKNYNDIDSNIKSNLKINIISLE